MDWGEPVLLKLMRLNASQHFFLLGWLCKPLFKKWDKVRFFLPQPSSKEISDPKWSQMFGMDIVCVGCHHCIGVQTELMDNVPLHAARLILWCKIKGEYFNRASEEVSPSPRWEWRDISRSGHWEWGAPGGAWDQRMKWSHWGGLGLVKGILH